MDFTEDVYKNIETDKLYRILDTVFIDNKNELIEANLIVGIDGVKIVVPIERFEVEYILFTVGEKIA
jgi:hypothetical protein